MSKNLAVKLAESLVRTLKKHSPAIFTGIAVAGTVGAVVLAVNATPKAEKLIEEARKEKKAAQSESYEDFINRMCGAWRDDPRSTEQIIADIRGSRQFDVTRHIMPLTDEKE